MLGKYRCNAIGSQVLEFRQSKRKNKTYYLCNQWQCQCLVNDVSAAYRNPIDLLGRCGSSSFLSFLIFLRSFFFFFFFFISSFFLLFLFLFPRWMDGACICSDLEGISSASDDLLGQVSFLSSLSLSLSLLVVGVLFVYTLGRVRYI